MPEDLELGTGTAMVALAESAANARWFASPVIGAIAEIGDAWNGWAQLA